MISNTSVFDGYEDTRSLNALEVVLVPEPVDAAQLVDGTPSTAVHGLGEIFGVEFGLWEMTEGAMQDVEAEELFIVLAGRATVTVHAVNGYAEQVFDLVAGSVCHLREGMHTTWVVDEPLRKVYLAK
ncbi:cupin domain-containing protein [Glutamicibacter sp.]|uniref:cupin domain-containing protein n=1 Tax=Glutamicibacter sp. TaxID=1931995 RepID=UPI0028BDD56D|nr:cupin domain-containing protein [Glutamicibacter sp.]